MVVLSVRPASEPRRMLWAPSRTLTWDTEPHDPAHLSGAAVHTVGRSQDPLLGYEAPSAEVLEVEGARAHLPVHKECGHPWEGVGGGLLPAHYLLGRPRLPTLAGQGGPETPLEPRELILHAVAQQVILDDSAHKVVWHWGVGTPGSQYRMPGKSITLINS